MKYCGILKTDLDFRIDSRSLTTSGLTISSSPYIRVEIDGDEKKVVEAIREAFENNKIGVPHPIDFKSLENNYVKSLGFKSLVELHKKSIYCSAQSDNGLITFTPTKNEKGRKGFDQLNNVSAEIVSINGSDKEIFEALERAFSKCE